MTATCSAQRTPGVPRALPRGEGAPVWAAQSFRSGVVSTNHQLASDAGAQILERGGNAVDATVAAAFVLNVVEPQNSGIGGAAQYLIHTARGEAWAVDGREMAPAAATPDQLVGKTDYQTSGIAVAVPGSLRAAEEALHRFGTLSLREALEPAIELAERGFPVSPALARSLASGPIWRSLEAAATFSGADGRPLTAGSRLVQSRLARALRLIADQGSEAFYRGAIAPAIVAAARARARLPGYECRLTLADLGSYEVTVRRPLVAHYRGHDVLTFPPSSSGGLVLLESLLALERLPLADRDSGFGAGSFRAVNALLEAARLAHADRVWWSGDDRFAPVPEARLLASGYVAARSALIDPDGRLAEATAGDPKCPGAPGRRAALARAGGTQTTHLSVADRDGNLVALTTTLADGFGSGIFVPGYGFFLNNSGIKFNAVPQRDAASDNPSRSTRPAPSGGKRACAPKS